MSDFKRYAVYFAPEAGSPLAEFGATWLGWDAEAGHARTHPEIGLPVSDITVTPRKYGFHGTLKPPFRLADGTTRLDLEAALEAFAQIHRAFEMPPLRLASLGRFLALIPSAHSRELQDLAFACVTTFEPFRAPLTEADLAKRRAAGLSPRQDALLQQWGYPYVDDEFRFHLTLSGALEPELLVSVEAALAPITAPLCAAPLAVREICLFGEAETGQFHVLRRFPLQG